MSREGRAPAQDGEARPRHRRRLLPWRHEASQPAGGSQTVHPAVHPVPGARVPVPRRELQATVVPEDEASGDAHEDLQAEDEGRLPDLQAADSAVLLPREALHGDEVLGAVLQQHKTEAEAAAGAAAGAAGEAAAAARGGDEHARGARAPVPAAAARARVAAALEAARGRGARHARLAHLARNARHARNARVARLARLSRLARAAQRTESTATGTPFILLPILLACNTRTRPRFTCSKHVCLRVQLCVILKADMVCIQRGDS